MTAHRILYICDFNGHGGTQTHLMTLFSALDRRRYRPWLATLNLDPVLARRLESIDVEVTNLGITGALRLHTARSLRDLAGEASRRGVDLIHGYLFSGNLAAAGVSRISGLPCMTSVRNLDIWKKLRHRIASALAHRQASHVLFNSSAVRKQVVVREWIDSAKSSIIYNSVIDPRQAGERRNTPGEPVVVCVASLRPKKGHKHLLGAFTSVRREIPGATLVLVGEGPERGTLERQAELAGLAGAVRFCGYRDDVAAILARADLFVLASLEEGMPNALLEAMAAGLPAVVTDVGGNAEALADGSTGFLVPAGDQGTMAARMIEILRDPVLAGRLSTAARRRYEESFTIDRMVSAYQDLYDRLSTRDAG